MTLRQRRWQALRNIERDLADSDPDLDRLFCCFNRQALGGKMPSTEKIRESPAPAKATLEAYPAMSPIFPKA